MLKGMLRAIDHSQMRRLHEAVMNVLETTGLLIRGPKLLEGLADAGCKVDFQNQRAWFKADLVEKQIAGQRDRYPMVRSSLWYPFCREMSREDAAWPDEFCVDFGFGAPWIYEYPSGEYRRPTMQDQVSMIKLGNALSAVKAVNAPFVCGDVDPRIETIESSRALLLNTRKPGWVGTNSRAEVKYLAEFAALAANHCNVTLHTAPPIIVNAYCTTSPLKIDTRSCEVLLESLPHKFPVNFASMPILGGTTPVTPAGSVVVAAAEILGGITAASLLAPDVFYYGTSIAGEMDMRTTQICYGTPAPILTDVALHQMFRDYYGLVLNVESGYVDAKCPGLQAASIKMYRQMAFACTASCSLPVGLLDNGAVFSPTQAMLDLDASKAVYMFGRGIDVSEETMCVDLINQLEFCQSRSYLDTDHTLNFFRDVLWDPKYFDRTYRKDGNLTPGMHDTGLLDKADKDWRDLVASQAEQECSTAWRAELDRIAEAARKELLA
jgi:trimethylamine--corrinoid protein Co-methyltransferase